MECPRCGGLDFVQLDRERMQCASRTIINVLPPHVAPNATGVAQPVWGTCATIFTAQESAGGAERRGYWARRNAESRAWNFQMQDLERDPETPGMIRALAANVIARKPEGTVPVVGRVEIRSRRPFSLARIEYAELYRVWPLGERSYETKELDRTGPVGINSRGRIVLIPDEVATVPLEPRMRVVGGPMDDLKLTGSHPRASTLLHLRAAAAS